MEKIYVPRDFFAGRVFLFPDWVSNRHIAIHRSRILNASDFASKARVERWMLVEEDEMGDWFQDIKASDTNKDMDLVFAHLKGACLPFRITDERLVYGNADRAVVLSRDSEGPEMEAFFAEPYVDALGFAPGANLYGAGADKPFMNAKGIDEATIILMPLNPKTIRENARRFNQETWEPVEE